MAAPEEMSEEDLLDALRLEYIEALEQEDYNHITQVIVPRFLERFRRYYDEYSREWRDVSLSGLPVRVVIDPRERREMEIEWADQVLKGEIEILPA